ncbi:AraC family transcriptional regulator [Undibacterium sp. TJN25]|uniref:AraC family transcriptional regulator n=1 Tax=Undibacterium sp. TJN25 TaxID=3413056 RepID=UPI003BF1B8D8
MSGKPILRISPSDLDNLMATLEVDFVKLSECLVSPGWRLVLAETDAPGIHYNLSGTGRMIIGDQPPIELLPHTLIIVPPRQSFRIEVKDDLREAAPLETVESRWQTFAPGALRRYAAGEGEPRIMLICGYFKASYGASIDLFAGLAGPIVERFDAADQLDQKLKAALAELVAQEIGMGAMTTALLKQVFVTLLRRSLSSLNLWVERFSILSDPHIARAFADMVAQPGAPHSVQSLAQSACLSRSAFMVRFTGLFGKAPMAALRELRMRQAASLLAGHDLSIEQISRNAGYASRSSFLRAFRKSYGCDPSEYRAGRRCPLGQPYVPAG